MVNANALTPCHDLNRLNQAHIINLLAQDETESLTIDQTLFNRVVESLMETFGVKEAYARITVTKALKELYG